MQKRARQAIVTVTAGLTLIGGVTTAAMAMSSGQGGDAALFAQLPPAAEASSTPQSGLSPESQSTTTPDTSGTSGADDGTDDSTVSAAQAAPPVKVTTTETSEKSAAAETAEAKSAKSAKTAKEKAKLPTGRATATSFWDAQTASGKPMRYATIASPYWPLGTKVKVSYKGKSVIGVVEDFGPAEWAVAQHDIPAIVDLSEKMMADLTGVRSNTVHVNFEVLKWGSGGVYRTSGTGYNLAMGR
ncbi:RlpA-like double-psi beta-barrel domain-containing protein [Microtetraspora sp. NBRC 16547]|uniref:RlpA-like double-psi beta-barrel domain-containing protein n=1 Tax=Microtetraspora sp. NBRC 16547 TaxID=3030993 RepID=UPI0024A0D317|nr:RlpA-like double-psi beta-barrel domain-containing protein [Microtetraspora sp. NBRC 16547]GLW97034.1 hypothetical protein Misp02_11210 [Microtetraspora sp. NBRC 16547]